MLNMLTVNNYFAMHEVRPQWRVVCAHSFISLETCISRGMRSVQKSCLKSRGNTDIEKVRQMYSKKRLIHTFIANLAFI